MSLAMADIVRRRPVIPVLTIARLEDAVPLARALSSGGLDVLEVTMRTPVALAAITRIKSEMPSVIVGAGTVLQPEDMVAAVDAGADFTVSPGATRDLVEASTGITCPYLPGAATASEAMSLLAEGFTIQKFFPAEFSGGPGFLKALSAPLPDILFCPTGGVSAANASGYLALANVVCVGASWPAPDAAIKAQAWGDIETASRQAAALPRASAAKAGSGTR